MRGSKISRYETFFERRRARQGSSESERAYTFQLAALHLQLLVAMAAVDENVRMIEEEEILAFIDRASLGQADIERLEQLARTSLRTPPALDALLEQLATIARKPAIARMVVADLARVAAADSIEDPRETQMLETVCETLKVEHVRIVIDETTGGSEIGSTGMRSGTDAPAPPPSRGARLVNRYRTRAAVRKALEASYRDDAAR